MYPIIITIGDVTARATLASSEGGQFVWEALPLTAPVDVSEGALCVELTAPPGTAAEAQDEPAETVTVQPGDMIWRNSEGALCIAVAGGTVRGVVVGRLIGGAARLVERLRDTPPGAEVRIIRALAG